MRNQSKRTFLAGFMGQLGLEEELLERPGTSVLGLDDRADTNIVAVYWAGARTFLWADPAVVERIGGLASEKVAAGSNDVAEHMIGAGFGEVAKATMRVLADGASGELEPAPLAERYRHGVLSADDPAHVGLVRAFAERNDRDDVEEAALDEIDEPDGFQETAINVVTPQAGQPGITDDMVAYASAAPWDWDPTFGDIGVLVEPDHRDHGLGRFVVAHTCLQLLTADLVPLYRHGGHNKGSAQLSVGLGFEPATELTVYQLTSNDD